MPRFKIYGLDAYIDKIDALSGLTQEYVGQAIYAGAEVVADATKTAIEGLETDERVNVPDTGSDADKKRSINKLQKKGLVESFGIASARYDGNFYNVKTGFDGYNEIRTKRWPMGQPNAMIARSLESGTSFMRKNPIITKATNQSKKKAIEAMQDSLNKSIQKIMK